MLLKQQEEENDVSQYKAGKLVINLEEKDKNDEFVKGFQVCAAREFFVGDE